jgi:hypothetical protein
LSDFADQKMIVRQRLQRFSRVLRLHRVMFFALKINDNLIQEQIPGFYLAEAPTLVLTICPRFQLLKLLASLRRNLSGVDQTLQIRIHKEA